MSTLDFSFELTGNTHDASVRLWFDNASANDLHSEIELPVIRAGNQWTASLELGDGKFEDYFWLRIAVLGDPGSSWSLDVSEQAEGEAGAQPLLSDGDILSMPKEWLVATCHRKARRGGSYALVPVQSS